MMNALTGAADELNKKSNKMQNSALKLKCPVYLDEAKLSSLTREPIKNNSMMLFFHSTKNILLKSKTMGRVLK